MYKNSLFSVREDVSNILYNKGLPVMTQERLAKLCGVSRQTIWAIESEESMPSYPLALRIFEILHEIDTSVVLTDLFPVPELNRASAGQKVEQSA